VYWTQVDDYKLPSKVGGHPALEFCNTWAGWGGPPLRGSEYLRDYGALAVWAGYQELIDPETMTTLRAEAERVSDLAERALAAARELRAGLYASLLDPMDAASFAVVRRYAEQASGRLGLVLDKEGLARWHIPVAAGLITPVLAVAWSAAELLGESRRHQVRACPGEGCGWLFLDPRGRRKWCSMAACGNRAKVNAYLRRRGENAGPAPFTSDNDPGG
jgi:hypothetical protein